MTPLNFCSRERFWHSQVLHRLISSPRVCKIGRTTSSQRTVHASQIRLGFGGLSRRFIYTAFLALDGLCFSPFSFNLQLSCQSAVSRSSVSERMLMIVHRYHAVTQRHTEPFDQSATTIWKPRGPVLPHSTTPRAAVYWSPKTVATRWHSRCWKTHKI